jgi:hypothetical protein
MTSPEILVIQVTITLYKWPQKTPNHKTTMESVIFCHGLRTLHVFRQRVSADNMYLDLRIKATAVV